MRFVFDVFQVGSYYKIHAIVLINSAFWKMR